MKALFYEKFQGPVYVKELPVPTASPNGVVVKVLSTGLCLSDWHGWMGHDTDISLPHVPGHEWAGIISEVGENVKSVKIGDRVTAPFVCGCGNCEQCDSGNHQVCDHQTQPGFTHWGSFAEYVSIENADCNIVKLPDYVDDISASILGCRFITAYRAVAAQGQLKQNEFIAIHGCGGVGLSAIMISKAIGAKIIAIDINNETLELAKSLGADYTVNAAEVKNTAEEIVSLTNGGVNVSIDALGSLNTCINSIMSLRKRGKHIQIGVMAGNHSLPEIPMGRVMFNELELIGSHGMQAHKYPEIFELIKKLLLNPQQLINKTISLADAAEILPQMDKLKSSGVIVINEF